jgi:hypothetical protein
MGPMETIDAVIVIISVVAAIATVFVSPYLNHKYIIEHDRRFALADKLWNEKYNDLKNILTNLGNQVEILFGLAKIQGLKTFTGPNEQRQFLFNLYVQDILILDAKSIDDISLPSLHNIAPANFTPKVSEDGFNEFHKYALVIASRLNKDTYTSVPGLRMIIVDATIIDDIKDASTSCMKKIASSSVTTINIKNDSQGIIDSIARAREKAKNELYNTQTSSFEYRPPT